MMEAATEKGKEENQTGKEEGNDVAKRRIKS